MLKILKLKEIKWEPDYYPRESFDNATAKSYAKAMKMGEKFPSIKVAQIDGTYYLVDGLHRLKATEINGKDHIQAWVNKDIKTLKDLYIEAVKLNTKHGRSLTNRDKEVIIKKLKELEVEEAEITKLILAPISDFKPIDYGKFRRSVGIKKSRRWDHGRPGRPRQEPVEFNDDVSTDTLLSSIDSLLACLRTMDFSSLDESVLQKTRHGLRGIMVETERIPLLSGFEEVEERLVADVDEPLDVSDDDDDEGDDFESDDPTKLCSVCGMSVVSGDGYVCDGCDNDFPRMD
jgi:ParB/Sulfiredoxin domain